MNLKSEVTSNLFLFIFSFQSQTDEPLRSDTIVKKMVCTIFLSLAAAPSTLRLHFLKKNILIWLQVILVVNTGLLTSLCALGSLISVRNLFFFLSLKSVKYFFGGGLY